MTPINLRERAALAALDRVEREHPEALARADVGAVVQTLTREEELMAKKKKDEGGARINIGVRVPSGWIAELDAIAAEANAGPEARLRGETYSRSDAARWLIGEGLERRREKAAP